METVRQKETKIILKMDEDLKLAEERLERAVLIIRDLLTANRTEIRIRALKFIDEVAK